MSGTSAVPNPGSPEAKATGCACPVMDNCHGRGYLGGVRSDGGTLVFVLTEGCPLHWPPLGMDATRKERDDGE